MSITQNITALIEDLPTDVSLVAVSKTKPISDLMEAYHAGQRIFGENKIQEMVTKWEEMPKDIEWHMIGHVQTNKVKYMAPFVSLIHAVDRLKLLKEIQKEAAKNDRVIKCLLQIKIAEEDSKFGLTQEDAIEILESTLLEEMKNISIVGLMGMATFTSDRNQLSREFSALQNFYNTLKEKHSKLEILSMGMSGDYDLALQYGSTMVRVGSAIFGARNYS